MPLPLRLSIALLPPGILLLNAPLTELARTGVAAEAGRRRTFAIIAHPDAGKTTLTEKLLLKGGAIQLAGRCAPRLTAATPAPTG
jgi:hypothetical protein